MRYVIEYMRDECQGNPVTVSGFGAVIADNHLKAIEQFRKSNPGYAVLRLTPVNSKEEAFNKFGMGGWTDEENEEYRAHMKELRAHEHDKHEEARKAARAYSLDEFAAEQEYAARRASEATQNLDGVHVGDIFYTCWGYEQTNYDFYQVVRLKGKHTAVFRKNAAKKASCGDMTGYSRPIRDKFCKENEYTVRTVQRFQPSTPGKISLTIDGHSAGPAEFGKLYNYTSYA